MRLETLLIGDLDKNDPKTIGSISGVATFVIHEDFHSFLRLDLRTTFTDKLTAKLKSATMSVTLYNLSSITSMKSVKLSDLHATTKEAILSRTRYSGQEGALVVCELSGSPWTCNVFGTSNMNESNQLRSALCEHLKKATVLSLYIAGTGLEKTIDGFWEAQRAQLMRHPLVRFVTDGARFLDAGTKPRFINLSAKDRRPHIITPALITFPDMLTYCVHNVAALVQEAEYSREEIKPLIGKQIDLVSRGKGVFTAFLDLPRSHTDLKEGQLVTLTFPMTGSKTARQYECVIRPVYSKRSARPCGYLLRSRKVANSYAGPDDHLDVADNSLLEGKRLVNLSFDILDVDEKRQLEALQQIQMKYVIDPEGYSCLLATDFSAVATMDFYQRVGETACERELILSTFLERISLNERQLQAFQALRRAPHVHIIHGPGGTGKSEFATLACQPLLMASPVDGKRNQVLYVCGSNINVDDLAERALVHARRFVGHDREPIVVRLHAYETELAVFTGNAEWKICFGNVDDKIDADVTSKLMQRLKIDDINEQIATMSDIKDHRLKLKEQSLGNYMKRVLGLLDADDPLFATDKFADLRQAYGKWSDLSKQDAKKSFMNNVEKLVNYVLGIADIVVTTTSNAAIPQLRQSRFDPCAIIVDEAGRLTEAATWPLFGHYPRVPILMLGDRCQTGPVVNAREEQNGFSAQLELPFFSRLLDAGASNTTFVLQHRYPSNVCDFLSRHFYDNELESGVDVDKRPLISTLQNLNEQKFGKRALMLYLDVPASKCQTLGDNQTSRLNTLQLAVVLRNIDGLLAAGISGSSIGIASPYSAMDQYALAGREWLALKHPEEAPKITLATIDGFTGLECDIMFIPLVNNKYLGFLDNTARICTALTRCCVGFTLVGNRKQMAQSNKWGDSALRRVIDDLVRCGLDVQDTMLTPPDDMTDFFPDFEDLKDFEPKCNRRTECWECGGYGHRRRECPN